MLDLIQNFDNNIYEHISKIITDGLTIAMRCITFLGSGWFLVFVCVFLMIYFLYKKYQMKYPKFITLMLVTSYAANEIIKYIIKRERPEILRLTDVHGYSFPSGHSMVSMCFYGFVIYLIHKNFKSRYKIFIEISLSVIIFLIGFSRIYLGVHYTTDVIFGFIIGFIYLLLFIKAVKEINSRNTSKVS